MVSVGQPINGPTRNYDVRTIEESDYRFSPLGSLLSNVCRYFVMLSVIRLLYEQLK